MSDKSIRMDLLIPMSDCVPLPQPVQATIRDARRSALCFDRDRPKHKYDDSVPYYPHDGKIHLRPDEFVEYNKKLNQTIVTRWGGYDGKYKRYILSEKWTTVPGYEDDFTCEGETVYLHYYGSIFYRVPLGANAFGDEYYLQTPEISDYEIFQCNTLGYPLSGERITRGSIHLSYERLKKGGKYLHTDNRMYTVPSEFASYNQRTGFTTVVGFPTTGVPFTKWSIRGEWHETATPATYQRRGSHTVIIVYNQPDQIELGAINVNGVVIHVGEDIAKIVYPIRK